MDAFRLCVVLYIIDLYLDLRLDFHVNVSLLKKFRSSVFFVSYIVLFICMRRTDRLTRRVERQA